MAPVETKFEEVVNLTKELEDGDVVTLVNELLKSRGLVIVPFTGVRVEKRPVEDKTFEEHVAEAEKTNS